MSTYADFLAQKVSRIPAAGCDVPRSAVHPMLHDWQAELVQWACKIGRAAIWADTGLGKTIMQVQWANLMRGNGIALIVAPLAVCAQTVLEASKVGVSAPYVRSGDGLAPGVYVTNYEMVQHFDADELTAVVLDEASILKQSDGKTRTSLIETFADVPYRLACTATPAPNDPEELTNQAEFLGHMSRTHMLAAYFIHDDAGWRLKGHARAPMMEWMATWAVALRKPSDLGYDRLRQPPRHRGADHGADSHGCAGLMLTPITDADSVAAQQDSARDEPHSDTSNAYTGRAQQAAPELGLPVDEMTEAITVACGNSRIDFDQTFRYFCGVCYRKLEQIHDGARDVARAGVADGA